MSKNSAAVYAHLIQGWTPPHGVSVHHRAEDHVVHVLILPTDHTPLMDVYVHPVTETHMREVKVKAHGLTVYHNPVIDSLHLNVEWEGRGWTQRMAGAVARAVDALTTGGKLRAAVAHTTAKQETALAVIEARVAEVRAVLEPLLLDLPHMGLPSNITVDGRGLGRLDVTRPTGATTWRTTLLTVNVNEHGGRVSTSWRVDTKPETANDARLLLSLLEAMEAL